MSLNDPNLPEEPLLGVGTITGLASAVIAVLVAFAVPLSQGQQVAILGLVAVVAPLVVAGVARRKVFAPATVRTLLANRRAPTP